MQIMLMLGSIFSCLLRVAEWYVAEFIERVELVSPIHGIKKSRAALGPAFFAAVLY